jgi:lipoate-protein ligase A
MAGGWKVVGGTASPAEHHAAVNEPIEQRAVSHHLVSAPALVLGSTQAGSLADAAVCSRLGLDVVRRRTGGGAVVLRPDQVVWLDVSLPRGDPLWDDDVGRAGLWVADAWARAVRSFDLDAVVHEGEPLCSRWGRTCCFAGIGPGEVRIGGSKAVGISQRRRRDGARFQTLAYVTGHDPTEVVRALTLPRDEATVLGDHLRSAVSVLDVEPARLVDAVVDALP